MATEKVIAKSFIIATMSLILLYFSILIYSIITPGKMFNEYKINYTGKLQSSIQKLPYNKNKSYYDNNKTVCFNFLLKGQKRGFCEYNKNQDLIYYSEPFNIFDSFIIYYTCRYKNGIISNVYYNYRFPDEIF